MSSADKKIRVLPLSQLAASGFDPDSAAVEIFRSFDLHQKASVLELVAEHFDKLGKRHLEQCPSPLLGAFVALRDALGGGEIDRELERRKVAGN